MPDFGKGIKIAAYTLWANQIEEARESGKQSASFIADKREHSREGQEQEQAVAKGKTPITMCIDSKLCSYQGCTEYGQTNKRVSERVCVSEWMNECPVELIARLNDSRTGACLLH